MKVFAQFIDGILPIRLNTILQFGDSWDPIAAVWLINPGSSKAASSVSPEEKVALDAIDNNNEWSIASIDATMGFLEKVLNGSYIGEHRELNGVVRLFNLYNLRQPILAEALKTITENEDVPNLITIDQDVNAVSGIKNIYLGWGNAGKWDGRELATRIFSQLDESQKQYCDPDFDKNAFYHPMYVNRGIRFKKTKDWLRKYYDSTEK